MTPDERRAEFARIWDGLPGRDVDRLRAIAAAAHVGEQTVRQWRINPERKYARAIPARSLRMIRGIAHAK